MIRRFLEWLEDPQRPLFGPNYKLLQFMGFVLPKSRKGRIAYILLHLLTIVSCATEFVDLYNSKTDMQEVITNLRYSMLSIVCAVKGNTAILWHNDWNIVFDYVTEADKYERDNTDEVKWDIIKKYTRYCRRVTYMYWTLMFTTLITVIITPILMYISSPALREGVRNGTEPFPRMYNYWTPWDKDHSPGCWLMIPLNIYLCSFGAGILAAYDSTALVIMVFFSGQLELLRERCKQMMGRLGKGISEEEADKAIRQIHNIHTLLTKNSRLFNSLMSPTMFLYVVMCSLMLCTSAYQLTVATDTTQKILTADYLIYGVAELFLFCWHSNDVLTKSEEVSLGPYESQWWAASVRQRKSVLILLGQLRISYLFTAGPFTNLTLATFITVLKGAYSWFTLLRQ